MVTDCAICGKEIPEDHVRYINVEEREQYHIACGDKAFRKWDQQMREEGN